MAFSGAHNMRNPVFVLWLIVAAMLTFVLARGIGQAFTAHDVAEDAVIELLREEGCTA